MLGIGNYLWRLIPANPILLRVVESGGKRKRDLLIRCGYLGVLLLLVVFMLLGGGTDTSAKLAELSKQSGEIFFWMSNVQLALVALLAPIFTAGAITQEKDSQTYDILLSTPLTNAQIVLGSLLSRLFFVVSLLISGIPIFSITQLFGGVAIRDIAYAFLIASATAFVTGSLAMAIAVFKVGTRRTIFSFYLLIMLYLAIPMVIEQIGYLQFAHSFNQTTGFHSHISWFSGIHPFLAMRVIFGDPRYQPPEPGSPELQGYGWVLTWYLTRPHTFYITFMFLFSLVLVTPSTLLLRRLAQSTNTMQTWILQKLHISTGDKSRKPRRVWTNPIAWREAKTKASASRAVLIRYGFMIAGVAGAVVLAVMSSMPQPSRAYLGPNAYNAEQRTLTIMTPQGNEPSVTYMVRVPGDRTNRGTPTTFNLVRPDPTGKQSTTDPQPVSPDALQSSMEVDWPNLIVEGDTRKTIKSITVGYPHRVLSDQKTRQFLMGAMMVELAVILLILTQSAASTVTREKEDGTLDLLLSSPITSRYYIWGKLRGLVSFVLPLIAVPVVSVLIFVVTDLIRPGLRPPDETWTVFPEAVFILPATLIMVCAFAAILGMQMSLRCRRTVMAVMSSVGIVGGACGGLFLCGYTALSGTSLGSVGTAMGCFSPFTLMAMLISPRDAAMTDSYITSGGLTEFRIMLIIFGWIAAGVYALIVWTMYKSMVKNFDMTIRKQAQ